MSSTDKGPEDAEALRLADSLVEKPLIWSRAAPAPSDKPILSFVMFRAFVRALKQYRSIVHLLRSEQWEDALILARSLYELALNLSEIASALDPDQTAKKFVAFGRFQQLRLEQRRLEDKLTDAKLAAHPSEVPDSETKLAAVASALATNFAQFRTPKVNGRRRGPASAPQRWLNASRNKPARNAARAIIGYFGLPRSSRTIRRARSSSCCLTIGKRLNGTNSAPKLDKAGRELARHLLREASVCFVDIVGMTGSFIAGYERKWFDEFALPLIEKF